MIDHIWLNTILNDPAQIFYLCESKLDWFQLINTSIGIKIHGISPFKQKSGIFEVVICITNKKVTDIDIKSNNYDYLWNDNFHLKVKNAVFTEILGSANNPLPSILFSYSDLWIIISDLFSSVCSIFEVKLSKNEIYSVDDKFEVTFINNQISVTQRSIDVDTSINKNNQNITPHEQNKLTLNLLDKIDKSLAINNKLISKNLDVAMLVENKINQNKNNTLYGDKGLTGLTGDKGDKGPTGLTGDKGDKG
ncbi:MAG: hypothetical protein OXF77_00575, partial [Thaumarchaeota archaeon]|nr:hypothetical protein [Nitrososphaerota archaeon]